VADYPWEPSGGRPHPGYDVLVLNDQTEWPAADRTTMEKVVDAGRGIVVLHNALGDNQTWPWWYREVTGGLLMLNAQEGMKKSEMSSSSLALRPAGKHPILRDVEPFTLAKEECYRGMWQAPGITPLLQTTRSARDKTVAWIGVHPKARVVCIQPGATAETHRDLNYRKLVRNSILWASGRI